MSNHQQQQQQQQQQEEEEEGGGGGGNNEYQNLKKWAHEYVWSMIEVIDHTYFLPCCKAHFMWIDQVAKEMGKQLDILANRLLHRITDRMTSCQHMKFWFQERRAHRKIRIDATFAAIAHLHTLLPIKRVLSQRPHCDCPLYVHSMNDNASSSSYCASSSSAMPSHQDEFSVPSYDTVPCASSSSSSCDASSSSAMFSHLSTPLYYENNANP